jgi:uncharacterized repeat protein (TIGR03943 family)
MTAVIQRWVSATVLAVWGAVLTYFFFSGRIASYLHPAFHPWIAACGVVLLLMAAGTIFLPQGEACSHEEDEKLKDGQFRPYSGGVVLQNPSDCGHDHGTCGHDHHSHGAEAGCCGHDHEKPKVRIGQALVLIVPLLVATTVSPSQFGAAAVVNRGYVQNINDLPGYQPYVEPALPTEDGSPGPTETKPSSDYLPRNAAGQITAQTVDLLYAAEEPTMREDFDGKDVEMIGQYMPAKENNPRGDRFNLVRMFVMCCAADARPVAVSVETKQPPGSPEMSWVKVVGKATFPLEGGRRVPVVVAESITPTEPPPESFIY